MSESTSSLADRIQQRWYSRSPGVLWLLWPLELIFRFLAAMRRLGYRMGLFRRYQSTWPIVVVGNIAVGGTGKTPLVVALVNTAQQMGLRPAVISRGYGGESDHYPLWVTPQTDPKQCGDEPALIAHQCGVPVVVGPDRIASIQQLEASGECDLIICDDGLQHYRMGRDLELVVVDATRGLGNRHCLPVGPLREPPARLSTIDALIINGAGEPEWADVAEHFTMKITPLRRYRLSGENLPLTPNGDERRIHAIAGIGNPQRFFATLRQLGWQPIEHPFPDHHPFTQQDLQFGDGLPVIMTEKDAVKCQSWASDETLSTLQIGAQLPEGALESLLSRVIRQ